MAYWHPLLWLGVAASCAACAWLGVQAGRRAPAPPPGDAAQVAISPSFWCDLRSAAGMAQMSRMLTALTDEAVEAIISASRDRIAAVKGESTDLDRLFFLADREQKRRATLRAMDAASAEARRILRVVLSAPRACPPLAETPPECGG